MNLLDTDICSYLMKGRFPALIDRVSRFAPGRLKVSSVTVYELASGVALHPRAARLERNLDAFLVNVEVLPFDTAAAFEAGRIRADLKALGRPIGAYDLLLAGHARAIDATLVTNNEREFRRVAGLRVENWTLDP